MKFNIRKFKASDIFIVARIIKKCGIAEFRKAFVIAPAIARQGAEKVGAMVTANLITTIIENMENCEQEVYSFLADISGTNEKEISELEPADFITLIGTIKESDGFSDFFTAVKKYFFSEKKKS